MSAKNGKKDGKKDSKLDPVAEAILAALAGGAVVAPDDVAKSIAAARAKPSDGPGLWRRYLPAVKQQAVFLARQGRIEILRKGQPADPNDFRGLVKLRLKTT
ncbi:MAG: DUF3253 domain-containing protein [Hyphomicrobiales bacterium]|nr:DUF3253 domain-containing protein [Hyphomicrobiales bacterium]